MKLIDKSEAASHLAEMFKMQKSLELFVSEDICFKRGDGEDWVSLGSIELHPGLDADEQGTRYDENCAIRFGGFEWLIPNQDDLDRSIKAALPENMDEKCYGKIKKAFHEGLQDVIRRTHLCLPVFDADTVAMLPLRRPTTIVPDTSAVHQGALDFVCRFLFPWARVKVPAIVYMEILNNVDNYFKLRFGSSGKEHARRYQALRQHLLSQGGQRTLLRMELTPEIELDRGDLGADPLRGIVTPSSDREDKNLGLQNVTPSFADRLIVETARRFQSDVRPDHPLFVITSDQGMARMAMAEGLGVFFFQARSVPKVEGINITGALYHPFSSDIYTVSLVDVLWELAVSFGRARLSATGLDAALDLWGIGADSQGVTWQPLHAKEDLLWAKIEPERLPPTMQYAPDVRVEPLPSKPKAPIRKTSDLSGSYKFSPNKMLSLIGHVVKRGHVSRKDAQELINVQGRDTYLKYERFLRSGELVLEKDDDLYMTDRLLQLWDALTAKLTDRVLSILISVPSFHALLQFVKEKEVVSPDDPEMPTSKSARSTYLALGEAACAWLRVVDRGIVFTPNVPGNEEFSKVAIAVYQKLRENDNTEWVLTGRWLEYLAVEGHVHPVAARNLLAVAKEKESIEVFAEGSTPDTRFDEHCFWMIADKGGPPCIERKYLYHGDFILPGTAAVRIKIQGVNHAS